MVNTLGTHWNLDVNKLRTRWELGWNTKGTLISIKSKTSGLTLPLTQSPPPPKGKTNFAL